MKKQINHKFIWGVGIVLLIALIGSVYSYAQSTNSNSQTLQSSSSESLETALPNKNDYMIYNQENTIINRYVCLDKDWERPYNDDYSQWLLNLELYPDGHDVRYYNGMLKSNVSLINVGVLKMDLVGTFNSKGKEVAADLQQCADACMRIWAEYLWGKKQYSKIHFKGGNGFVYEYTKWAEGYRVHFDKSWHASWHKDAQPDYGYTSFRKYLSLVFMYCGTLSLAHELKKIAPTDVRPGDILIYGGSPGHALTVMDVLRNKKTGQLRVMFSQSYMPAQEIEILTSPDDDHAPWFTIDIEHKPWVNSPQWYFDFNKGSCFRRWGNR